MKGLDPCQGKLFRRGAHMRKASLRFPGFMERRVILVVFLLMEDICEQQIRNKQYDLALSGALWSAGRNVSGFRPIGETS